MHGVLTYFMYLWGSNTFDFGNQNEYASKKCRVYHFFKPINNLLCQTYFLMSNVVGRFHRLRILLSCVMDCFLYM